MNFKRQCACLLLVAVLAGLCGRAWAQEDKLQPGDRERALGIWSDVMGAIRNDYYDPKYHGVDLDVLNKETRAQIDKATSFNQMLGVIAWSIDRFDDSHLFFIPPPRAYNLEYGWRMLMVGDKCLVTHVKPGSDAEKQGLKPGDMIETIMGVQPTRDNLFKLELLFNVLRPQPKVRLQVQTPDSNTRTLDVQAAIKPTRHEITNYNEWIDEVRKNERRSDLYERKSTVVDGNVFVWKLYDFEMEEKGADAMIGKARDSKALVLDLRGNPGGYAETTSRMVADFFDREVKVAEPRGRKKVDLKSTAKGRGDKAYTGKLIVLVDSGSASASEIFARVVQLEGRGTIVGDRSAGAVMLSEGSAGWHGLDRRIFYGVSVTKADMIMKDGNSLEKAGVTPDVVVLPTGEDLANNRDPALAKAVELAGGKITPDEAGKLFPFKWPPQ